MAQELTNGLQPEQLPVPEQSKEKIEAPFGSAESSNHKTVVAPPPTIPSISETRPAPKPEIDKMQKEIENVLTENIAEIYKQLPQDQKTIFKQKGEEIALKISGMIRGGLLEIKKILKMIREWLLIIPGVNKFFLEQETKIKTSKIQTIYEREHTPAL